VRVVSATNRDLQQMVEQEKFREDLYYRLSVVPIRVPALRERPHDLKLLSEYFLDDFCQRNNFRPKKLDAGVFALFESYHWPGNARELRNTIERMAILSPGDLLEAEAVPVEIRIPKDGGPKSTLHEAREKAEREHLLRALEDNDWNVSGAARALGMERTNLHKRIRSLGISRK
jgi:two-component system nitrogen regulation response regulator NtrX